jgi:hypothetical protein
MLLFFITYSVFSQKKIDSLNCKFSQDIIYSNWTSGGLVFTVENLNTEKIDTLIQLSGYCKLQNCFSNDSVAVFCLDNYSEFSFYLFKKEKDNWKSYSIIGVPGLFPNIGVVEDGKKYESYSHRLVSVDQINSILTIYQANKKGELTEFEIYDVIFRIDTTPKENPIFKGTAKTCTLIIEKKTLRND